MKIPHDQSRLLKISNNNYAKFVQDFFERELEIDDQDITFKILFKKKIAAQAHIIAKENGFFSGKEECEYFLNKLKIKQKWYKNDGEKINKNELILELEGDAKMLLKIERVILNFLSRMSGITSKAKEVSSKLPKYFFVAATRKTLWGFLDKKAVSVGGGLTHRLNLKNAILIKENHIKLFANQALDKKAVIKNILLKIDQNNESAFWEIEIETENEFCEVMNNLPKKRPGVIMFDNFKPQEIKKILEKTKKPKGIFFEASGGIDENNIADFVDTGVDVVSCGFLTKHAHSLDLSMKLL